MGTEVIITDPEENSVGIIVNENPTQVDVYIRDYDIPEKVEIIVDEFASQRAVDAAHAAELILQQMLELISENQPDALILVKEILRNENVFTFQAGEIWRVSRNNYSNDVDFVTEIEPEGTNLKRMDIVGGTPFGYQKISGPSSEDIVIPPDVPEDFVVRKIFNISGPDIDDSISPITPEGFVQKTDFSEVVLISSGILSMVLPASVGGIRFQGTNLEFQSLFIPDENNLWPGKPFKIKNFQNNSLTLKHLTGPGLQLSFPNSQNFLVGPNEIVEFEWYFNNANVWVLQYVGKIANVKRSHIINCTISGTLTANSSWWTASRESGSFLTPVFEATAQYNPITEVFLNPRAAKHLIPFKSRLKRICWNYSTLATPLTINVHSFQGNSTIFNEKTIASKIFPTGSSNNTIEYLPVEMNTSHFLEKNSYLTICLNNNNVSTGLIRPNVLQIELEEI